jgi:hypothetical protein
MVDRRFSTMKIIDVILNVFLIGMGILLIYWSMELLFGGSPTLQDFHIAITFVVLGFVVKMNREIEEMKVGLRHVRGEMKDKMVS